MRINRDPHRRSDRSEAQLNPKACRRAIHGTRAIAINRHHTWNTIQITVISPTCMPLGMRVMTNVTAQLPQRRLVVVVVVVFGLCCWGHGPNHPGAQQNLGEWLVKDLGRSR